MARFHVLLMNSLERTVYICLLHVKNNKNKKNSLYDSYDYEKMRIKPDLATVKTC